MAEAVKPGADVVRKRLRATGMHAGVVGVNSSPEVTRVATIDGEAEAVARALMPLWSDGATRVRVITPALVHVARDGWEDTQPMTAVQVSENLGTPRKCFTVMEEHRDADGQYIACLLVEGDPVIGVMSGNGEHARPWLVGTDRVHALQVCDEINADQFGMTPDERRELVAGWLREFVR